MNVPSSAVTTTAAVPATDTWAPPTGTPVFVVTFPFRTALPAPGVPIDSMVVTSRSLLTFTGTSAVVRAPIDA